MGIHSSCSCDVTTTLFYSTMAFQTILIISVLTILLLLSHGSRPHEHRALVLSNESPTGQYRSLKDTEESEALPRAMRKRNRNKRNGKKRNRRKKRKKGKKNAPGITF